ncbi:Uncharacterised protein [Mycobacteroides abscessus subsp. abscessus]|nr:Uncharacterised protein [Mycobacteroides abscessus subsp. abscessus]
MLQRVALARREFLDRLDLALGEAVEVDVAGVLAVGDHHARGHRMIGAEFAGDGRDDLLTGRRDHHDVAAAQLVVGDQVGGFGEHQGVDDVVQRLGDDRLDLFDVPARAHVRQVGPHAVHLIVVGTGHQEQKLGIGGLEDRLPVQQSLVEKRFAKSEGAGLGDHRFVEIEEGCGAHRTGRLGLLTRRGRGLGGRIGCGHGSKHMLRNAGAGWASLWPCRSPVGRPSWRLTC